MVNFRTILIAAAIAVAGMILLFLLVNSDEDVIKKRFQHLAEQLAKEPPEDALLGAAKASRIGRMFSDSCRVNLPAYDIENTFVRDDVQSYVIMARSGYTSIAVDFYDFNIVFPREGRAEVDVTAFAKTTTSAGEAVQEIHELVFSLEKVEDEWLFTVIEAVEVLER